MRAFSDSIRFARFSLCKSSRKTAQRSISILPCPSMARENWSFFKSWIDFFQADVDLPLAALLEGLFDQRGPPRVLAAGQVAHPHQHLFQLLVLFGQPLLRRQQAVGRRASFFSAGAAGGSAANSSRQSGDSAAAETESDRFFGCAT